jgi:PAS domain S-box-containing protein
VEDSIDAVGMAQEGKIIYVNDAFCSMFGYERDELIGQSVLRIAAPEYRSLIEERNRLRLAGQEVPNRYVFTGVKKDGEKLIIGFSSSVPFMHKGKPTVLAILRDITEQRQAQERIGASLKEKEVLLKEIQHRVKNNLQVISSLFDLQSRYTDDEQVLTMFKESRDRVRSIALIHEKLYQAEDLTMIDFADYIESLANHLFRSYGVSSSSIKLKTRFDSVSLSVDTAIPCALIVNELISNSLKHAFSGSDEGEIRIELRSAEDSTVTLVVSDNGVGLPESLDFESPASLGLRLVRTLTQQLKGSVAFGRDGGTTVKVMFRVTNREAGAETNGTGTDSGR